MQRLQPPAQRQWWAGGGTGAGQPLLLGPLPQVQLPGQPVSLRSWVLAQPVQQPAQLLLLGAPRQQELLPRQLGWALPPRQLGQLHQQAPQMQQLEAPRRPEPPAPVPAQAAQPWAQQRQLVWGQRLAMPLRLAGWKPSARPLQLAQQPAQRQALARRQPRVLGQGWRQKVQAPLLEWAAPQQARQLPARGQRVRPLLEAPGRAQLPQQAQQQPPLQGLVPVPQRLWRWGWAAWQLQQGAVRQLGQAEPDHLPPAGHQELLSRAQERQLCQLAAVLLAG